MKKYLCTILFVLLPFQIFCANMISSKVAPEWKSPIPALMPVDSLNKLFFTGAQYNKTGLPLYNCSFSLPSSAKTGEYTAELDSLIFEDCSEYEEELLAGLQIPDSISPVIKTSTYRGSKYLDVTILPLIRKDGVCKKLVSADIRVSNNAASLLREESATTSASERYSENSLLASGNWYKISVSSTGVYKLTYEDIVAMGFDNPATVAIYGYGGGILEEDFSKLETLARPEDDLPQVPVYMNVGSDGVFSAGDYLLFYAQGPLKEVLDTDNQRFSSVSNYYSNYGYYFVTCDAPRKEMETESSSTGSSVIEVNYGLMHHHIASEETNLLESGRMWYGYRFSSALPTRSFTLPFENINPSLPAYFDVRLIGYSTSSHYFTVVVDNGTSRTMRPSTITNTTYEVGKLVESSFSQTLSSSNNPTIDITYNYGTTSNYGYVLDIEANVVCSLQLNDGSLQIYYPYYRGAYDYARYTVSGADSNTVIWDITDPLNTSIITSSLQSGVARFTVPHADERVFLAVDTSYDFPTPTNVGTVDNQNLHGLEQCDMVIVTPSEYYAAAQTIANMHQTNDGAIVHIVTPEQVYNEFSSGTPDATAFRWLMKMFYDRAEGNTDKMPKGLLFIGLASYDNRGINNALSDMVAYQSEESLDEDYSYQSDDYCGFLDDDEGGDITSERMDIGVGRLPVSSLTEAQNVADKFVAYVNNSNYDTWRNVFTFVGDDGDDNVHSESANLMAERMRSINKAFNAKKFFFDAYQREQTTTGASYPQAKSDILSHLEDGTLVFTYFGHGSMNNMSHERVLTRSDVQSLTCENPALWLVAACNVARFDTPGESSIGMDVILNGNGAGIAILTSTRVVYSGSNEALFLYVFDNLVPQTSDDIKNIGLIVAAGKNTLTNNVNKMKYIFYGDPLMTLHYPYYNVVTDEINGVDPSQAEMQALGVSRITGHIEDHNGNTLENFSGNIHIEVYDKEDELSTLDNLGEGAFEYTDFISTIFRGNISVENGTFSTVFMVPKDINYSGGNGRIVYYASDSDLMTDAHGYNEDFYVGGTADDVTSTETGPQMVLFLNHESFVNGQTVNPSPVFYALLYDEYGINTSGSGIGHNLSMKLNGGSATNLNDYFTANLDDYTSGTVKYQLEDLEDGEYELVFKAWNMQNVSSEQSLQFVVKSDAEPAIIDFYATPNPASNYVTLFLEYDRPDNNSTVDFYVYDLTGVQYYHESVSINTEGTYSCTWDLNSGTFGLAGSGMYVAKATITTEEGTQQSKSIKILIIRQ